MQLAPLEHDRIDRSVLEGDDMSRTRLFFGLCVLALAGGIAVFVSAQGRATGSKSTHTTTAPKAAAPSPRSKTAPGKAAKTMQSPMKAQHPSPSAAAANTHTSKPAPATSASAAQPKSSPAKTQKAEKAPAPTKPAKSDKVADTKLASADKPAKTTKTTATTSTKTTTGTPTGTTTELTAVQQKLKQNTNLAAKVATRLPQGTDVVSAAAGFQNLGQFVAAANVSHNLQISFTELKAKMMTGMSLGQAIQAVRPLTASPTVEAQRAEYDARGMIYESDQTTPSTAAAPPSTTSASTPVKSKAKTKSSAQ
jgi:hypothetical protein